MATADDYAAWIVSNPDKRGTPDFDTVAQAYREALAQEVAPGEAVMPETVVTAEAVEPSILDDQAAQMAAGQQTVYQQMPEPGGRGIIGGLVEAVTGEERATETTRTLPEWTTMPELNSFSFQSALTGLGTLLAGPEEVVQVIQSNFPGTQIMQDEKGNFVLRSSIDGRDYVIPPGVSMGDIPRGVAGIAAFTPAGMARTIAGAAGGGAATQAAIEASQMAAGGAFAPEEVAIAGATGAALPAGQRLVQAAKEPVQRALGIRPPPPRVEPTIGAPPVGAQPDAPLATEAFEEVGELLRKARGTGPGSSTAKARLADLAQVNTDARAAAERLGMDLPFDVFSDNPQIRSAVGLTRSLAGGEAEAAWVNTVRTAINKADEVVQQFDANFIEGRPAPGATSQRILDNLTNTRTQLVESAKNLYDQVDAVVPGDFPAETRNVEAALAEIRKRLGPSVADENAALKKLERIVETGATYGGVSFQKSMLGAAKRAAATNIYATDLNVGIIKQLEAALAKDQLDTVGAFGGDEVRRQLRAANLLTAQKSALDKRIIGAFGKEADGSVATLMQSAIRSASKGDAAQFNKLMKVVPPELRKETLATALASVSSSSRAAQEGAFGFAEFAKTYRGLRANPPVYNRVIEVLGKDADPVLRDLFEVSRRITDARAQVLTTGKANQALVEAMKAEGLVAAIMQSSTVQRAVTGLTGTVPLGGVIAPDIIAFMSKGNGDAVKAAGKLFASDDFQKLAIEAATKPEVSQAALKRTATSKAFGRFAKAVKLPQSLDARLQFLQSAMQSGRQFGEEEQ